MQTSLQRQNPQANELIQLLERSKPQIAKALGSAMPPDFFLRTALTAFRKTPGLYACTQASLMQCVMDLAQVRLVPGGVTAEAHLIPFGNEATLIIGYQGYLKLVRRSSNVTNVYASVVYANDEFELEFGSNKHMKHVPALKGDKGEWLGAVAYIAYDNNGIKGEDFVWVPADYIARVKAQARGATSAKSPWSNWAESMWSKTALRQLLKSADLSPDVREQVGKAMDMEDVIDVTEVTDNSPAPQPSEISKPAAAASPKKTARKKVARKSEPPQQNEPAEPSPFGDDEPPMGDGNEPTRIQQPSADTPELFQ